MLASSRLPQTIVFDRNNFHSDINKEALRRAHTWKTALRRRTSEPMENASRLISLAGKGEMGPTVVDAYTEHVLGRYTKIEAITTTALTFAAALGVLASFSDGIFLIVTVVSAWLASIAYRAYRHHAQCLDYIRTLNSQICPHCGKPLVFAPRVIEVPIPAAKR